MAVACTGLHRKGKTYVSADNYPDCVINEELIRRRLDALCKRSGLGVPTEGIVDDSKNSFWVRLYGLTDLWRPVFDAAVICADVLFSFDT